MNLRRRAPAAILSGLLFLLALPASAEAHGAIKGVEGVVSGLVHPLTTPAHLLVMVSLGLLLAQRQAENGQRPFLVFLPMLALGMVPTVFLPGLVLPQSLLLGVALGTAFLAVLDKALPAFGPPCLAGLAGAVLGLDSGVESGSLGTVLKTLLGSWLMIGFLVFDVAYYASLALRWPWARVGLRVLASWIVAMALLMLAFALRRAG